MPQALFENGALVRYPYSTGDFMRDHPQALPDEPSDEDTAAVGLVWVVNTDKPEEGMAHRVVETSPAYVNGVLTQQWSLVPLSLPEVQQSFEQKLAALYDAKAAEKNYDSRYTCAVRAGYAGPFQSEGLAFAQWMDACNIHCYAVLSEVLAGHRSIPSWSELSAELPLLTWPA